MSGSLSRPRKAPDPASVEGIERVLADVPTSLYRRVKIRCLTRGIPMKRYLLGLIEADLEKTADDGTTIRTSARTPVRIVPPK